VSDHETAKSMLAAVLVFLGCLAWITVCADRASASPIAERNIRIRWYDPNALVAEAYDGPIKHTGQYASADMSDSASWSFVIPGVIDGVEPTATPTYYTLYSWENEWPCVSVASNWVYRPGEVTFSNTILYCPEAAGEGLVAGVAMLAILGGFHGRHGVS